MMRLRRRVLRLAHIRMPLLLTFHTLLHVFLMFALMFGDQGSANTRVRSVAFLNAVVALNT